MPTAGRRPTPLLRISAPSAGDPLPSASSSRLRWGKALPFAFLLAVGSILSVLLFVWDGDQLEGLSLPGLSAPTIASPLADPSSPPAADAARSHPIDHGLLTVDLNLPAAQHPIYQLIARGQAEWAAKNARQSTTLAGGVAEYRRRNDGRHPPKGFDLWWAWTRAHNVALPDEYDRISLDLAPFRALSPATLRARIALLQTQPGTFTLTNRAGNLSVHSLTYDELAIGGAHERAQGQLDLVRAVAGSIGDFDAVFNVDDGAKQFVGWETRERLVDAGRRGEYINDEDLLDLGDEHAGWGAACPPSSALRHLGRTGALSLDPHNAPPSPPTDGRPKRFVADLAEGMLDLCGLFDSVKLHGAFNGVVPVPSKTLLPLFSLSKSTLHSDILACPTEQFGEDGGSAHWIHKAHDRLVWRGRTTGGVFSCQTPWRSSHRARIARLGDPNATRSVGVLLPPDEDKVLQDEAAPLRESVHMMDQGRLNEHMTSIGLAYEPVQCDEADGTCAAISAELPYLPVMTFAEEDRFRYILDLDGNAWSARFKRVLNSRAVILKTTSFVEFWNDRVAPWVHFVPLQADFSDLFDVMAFFRGTEAQAAGEDALAYEIGQAGHDWSATHWRKDDMTAYMFRLYLEYARLWADEPSSMDFVLDEPEREGAKRMTKRRE